MSSQEFTYTKVPNVILDNFMSTLNGAELTILVFICRKTVGFQKKSDRIAYSTFIKGTGLTKPTVSSTLRKLIKHRLIIKNVHTTPHSYSLNVEFLQAVEQLKIEDKKFNSSKVIEPAMVNNSNHSLVKKINTQKNNPKETNTNSSTTINGEKVFEVIQEWNNRFKQKVKINDSNMVNHINKALTEFSVKEIVLAMDNRLQAEYYKTKKPELLHNPACFFPYLETIQNDMNREADSLFTYSQMLDMVFEKDFKESDFVILLDQKDREGNPMRQLVK